MANDFWNKLAKNVEKGANEIAKNASEVAQKAGEGLKNKIQDVPGDLSAQLAYQKLEASRLASRNEAFAILSDAQKGIQVQSEGRENLKIFVTDILSEMESLKKSVKKLSPKDVCESCDELIKKYAVDSQFESNDSDPNVKQMDNDKISRILKKTRDVYNEVYKIMEVQARKESNRD